MHVVCMFTYFVYCVAWYIVLHGILCCMVYYVAWYIVLYGILCCMVYCVAWYIMLHGILCCMVYCVAWYIVLHGILCCMVYCVACTYKHGYYSTLDSKLSFTVNCFSTSSTISSRMSPQSPTCRRFRSSWRRGGRSLRRTSTRGRPGVPLTMQVCTSE